MPRYSTRDKLSEIIRISADYKVHCTQLQNVRAAVNSLCPSYRDRVKLLTDKRTRYLESVRLQRSKELVEVNGLEMKRLSHIHSVYQQQMRPDESPTMARGDSRRSLHSSSSKKSLLSNSRMRTIRQQQIMAENRSMAKRLEQPKMCRETAFKSLQKSYERSEQILRIRSRFSERSQGIIKSLAVDTLGLSPKHLQFLPQLQGSPTKTPERFKTRHSVHCMTVVADNIKLLETPEYRKRSLEVRH